jgi:putative pyruvate formate lyase activating enzyme
MLKDYFSILKRKRVARHWICRSVPVPVGNREESPLEDLWHLHQEGMKAFREAWTQPRETSPVQPSLLDLKILLAEKMLEHCHMCERRCGANRKEGEKGFCKVGATSRVASHFLHIGEEPELVPSHTIFFSGCTFACVYCQNWDIAMHPEAGRVADPQELAHLLEKGLEEGSRNANFVGGNPDPNLHTILKTIGELGERARHLPMVWNSNMYTSREAMALLDGVMDIYLADFRYGNDDCARRLSDVPDYFAVVSRNFELAYRQGEIMLRQLVIPGHLECCTAAIMKWVKENIPGVYFNLMFQYRPEYRAPLFPGINRRLTVEERKKALDCAHQHGISLC